MLRSSDAPSRCGTVPLLAWPPVIVFPRERERERERERDVLHNAILFSPDKVIDLKQDKVDMLKPKLPPPTPKPVKQERKTTADPAINGKKELYVMLTSNIS